MMAAASLLLSSGTVTAGLLVDKGALPSSCGRCGVPILYPYLRTSSSYRFVLLMKAASNEGSDDAAASIGPARPGGLAGGSQRGGGQGAHCCGGGACPRVQKRESSRATLCLARRGRVAVRPLGPTCPATCCRCRRACPGPYPRTPARISSAPCSCRARRGRERARGGR